MPKTKLSLMILVFLAVAGGLYAEPVVSTECCKPTPVGGLKVLGNNTVYPLMAAKEQIDSNVVLRFDVDTHGSISNIVVAQSGGIIFDESAIAAVMNTSWNPAMQANRAVAVTFELPFEYRSH